MKKVLSIALAILMFALVLVPAYAEENRSVRFLNDFRDSKTMELDIDLSAAGIDEAVYYIDFYNMRFVMKMKAGLSSYSAYIEDKSADIYLGFIKIESKVLFGEDEMGFKEYAEAMQPFYDWLVEDLTFEYISTEDLGNGIEVDTVLADGTDEMKLTYSNGNLISIALEDRELIGSDTFVAPIKNISTNVKESAFRRPILSINVTPLVRLFMRLRGISI